jgi:hypothetical protein
MTMIATGFALEPRGPLLKRITPICLIADKCAKIYPRLTQMSSLQISLIALGCFVAGTALGLWLQHLLPDHHLSKESQDTVKLGAGMVATMSALVLGLLVSSANGSFSAMNLSIAQIGAKIIQLDHLLAEYGPETKPLRVALKQSIATRVEKTWSHGGGLHAVEKSTAMLDFQTALRGLPSANDQQKSIVLQAQQITADLWQNRLIMIEEHQEPVPTVFLALLVFWLTLMFLSFGLFAARNVTVGVVLFVCAFSVASAVFLILEMSHPLDGCIMCSSAPLLKALELIGQ